MTSSRSAVAHCRRRPVPVLLVAVLAIVGPACGDSAEKSGSATTTTAAAATTTSAVPRQTSAPRWETVSTFTGTADATTPTFAIAPDVIQWRVRWHCESGHLTIESDPKQQRHPEPTVDAPCVGPDSTPEKAVGYGIVEGQVKLVVKATSPWQITVDQQIDTPLLEPPLPGMDTAKVLGQGEFYDIEMKGKGKARMLELADGSRALRLEDFEVSSNTDLFLWLSEAPAPKTSKDAVDAPYVVLGNLKSTLGNENYVLPADLPPERIRSIVIWCAPVRIAYTAAVLAPPS